MMPFFAIVVMLAITAIGSPDDHSDANAQLDGPSRGRMSVGTRKMVLAVLLMAFGVLLTLRLDGQASYGVAVIFLPLFLAVGLIYLLFLLALLLVLCCGGDDFVSAFGFSAAAGHDDVNADDDQEQPVDDDEVAAGGEADSPVVTVSVEKKGRVDEESGHDDVHDDGEEERDDSAKPLLS